MSDDLQRLDDCGCCDDGTEEHAAHVNRPGLPALLYRLGTHSVFIRRMKARLPFQIIPDGPSEGSQPLAALTTREPDDPAIAFLDAWATVADVLTFYQERIANEGYLRTATERRSVLELARSIGYELNPGVAASAFLAFTVEDPPGERGKPAPIAAGTRVQSIPGPGERPQVFETSAAIQGRTSWNELRPRRTRPQRLAIASNQLYLLLDEGENPSGAETLLAATVFPVESTTTLSTSTVKAIKVGQVFFDGISTNIKRGDRLLFIGRKGSSIVTLPQAVARVETDSKQNHTRVQLAGLTTTNIKLPLIILALPLLKMVISTAVKFSAASVKTHVVSKTVTEKSLKAFLTVNRWKATDLVSHVATLKLKPLLSLIPGPDEDDRGVYVFRARAGIFGHNAPAYASLPTDQKGTGKAYPSNWDGGTGWPVWKAYPSDTQNIDTHGADLLLERTLPDLVGDTWTLIEGVGAGAPKVFKVKSVIETAVTGFSLSARSTGLQLRNPNGSTLTSSDKNESFKVRRTTAYAQSERLVLAELAVDERMEQGSDDSAQGVSSLTLERMVTGLQIDQPLILSGEQLDAPGVIRHEVVILDDIAHADGFTTLYFHNQLQYRYDRDTVTLNANVAAATHGETVVQALGSGDSATANQQFTLKKPPLTFVSAPTPSGAESTLDVRVNDVLWEEVPSLYGLTERDQAYTLRLEDDGTTTVIFGDGKQGARVPSGRENVVATYRSGIGPEGEVDANTLTLLQTRPLGVRSVNNPLAASGAAAPETLERARENAPLTMLAFERIVSLRDFEDFARAFAGIGKAQAVALWTGRTRQVHLTIASDDGEEITPSSPLYTNLLKAIDSSRDRGVQIRVDDYRPLAFNVDAKVIVDRRYRPEKVLDDVEAALLAAFSFEQRDFGQDATAAEVMTVIQHVPGVIATDLDRLYLVTDPDGPAQTHPASVLTADTAHTDSGGILAAQLLLINPAGVTLTEVLQ